MKTYKIKKGNHYSNSLNLPIPFVRLNKSFQYKFIIEAENFDGSILQDDWNKLFGFGIGLTPRSNSIRVGWRFNKDKSTFEWCIFREVNKDFIFSDLLSGASCTVTYDRLKETFEIDVNGENAKYHFDIGRPDRALMQSFIQLELQPYFGGNAVSDADYTINRY